MSATRTDRTTPYGLSMSVRGVSGRAGLAVANAMTPREASIFLDGALYGALMATAAGFAVWLWFGG
jgi:hypothetical protein